MTPDPLLGSPDGTGAALWPAVSPTPVALESIRSRPGAAFGSPRAGGQALLIGLMVVAFAVLVIARTTPLGGGAVATLPPASVVPPASSGVGASEAAPPSAAPAVSTAPSSAPSAAPTAKPSARPTTTPKPTAASGQTYTVQKGDTLWGISIKFGVTVKAIQQANNMTTTVVHVGDVLVIP